MPDRRASAGYTLLGLLAAGLVVTALAVPADAGHRWLRTLVPLGLGSGVAAGVLVTLAARHNLRQRVVLLPLAGLVVGLLVGSGADLWHVYRPTGSAEVVYHGRYVQEDGITMSGPYSSRLDITYDSPVPPWSLVLTGSATGLVVGLAVWARIRVPRSRTGPTPG